MKKRNRKKKRVDADILQGKADVLKAANAARQPVKTEKPAQETQQVEVKCVRDVNVEPQKPQTADQKQPKPERPSGESGERGVDIPHFNLAEQILSEQRRAASGRRQKAHKSTTKAQCYPANDTVGAVIRQNKAAPGNDAEVKSQESSSAHVHSIVIDDDPMSDAQRRLVADIVRRDIIAMCG